MLFDIAIQQHAGHLQVVEGEDMGEGRIGAGQLAHHLVEGGPVAAQAAPAGGDGQRQQAAVADEGPFGKGVSTGLVPRHGRVRQRLGQRLGDLGHVIQGLGAAEGGGHGGDIGGRVREGAWDAGAVQGQELGHGWNAGWLASVFHRMLPTKTNEWFYRSAVSLVA